MKKSVIKVIDCRVMCAISVGSPGTLLSEAIWFQLAIASKSGY